MNKTELVASVAEKANLSKKDAEACISAALTTVAESLKKGDSVSLVGYGSLSVVKRAARTVKSPQGNATKVPARNGIKFKAGSLLKDAVNAKK